MFELVVGKEDGTIENASIPVRWCVDPKLLESLGNDVVHYVLIIADYGSKTERFLCKMSDYMTYIPLSRSGEVKINAMIVNATNVKMTARKVLNKTIMLRYDHSLWEYSLYDYNDKLHDVGYEIFIGHNHDNDCATIRAVLDSPHKINIPKESFGKELPLWFSKLVNRYLESKPFDQCHRNRRVMSFFLIRMWMILAEVMIKEVIITLSFVAFILGGFFKFNPRALIHPLQSSWLPENIKDEAELGKHIVPMMIDGFEKHIESRFGEVNIVIGVGVCVLSFIFTPILYIIMLLITHGLFPLVDDIWVTLALPFLVYPFIVVIGGIICGFVMMVTPLLSKLHAPQFGILSKIGEIFNKFLKLFESNDSLKTELITCNGDANSITTNVNDIPFKERSTKLMYLSVKNKVCKPMAK